MWVEDGHMSTFLNLESSRLCLGLIDALDTLTQSNRYLVYIDGNNPIKWTIENRNLIQYAILGSTHRSPLSSEHSTTL